MIYIIDHNDSFTHNVVHQFSLYGKVECDNYNTINEIKLNKASVIIFSPGPGNPKDYPSTSKIYKRFKVLIFGHPITEPPGIIALIMSIFLISFFNLPLIKLT